MHDIPVIDGSLSWTNTVYVSYFLVSLRYNSLVFMYLILLILGVTSRCLVLLQLHDVRQL